jgi:hypothetical protein
MGRKCSPLGLNRRSTWFQGVGIDWKKSWAPPGELISVWPLLDPDESS